MGHTETIKHHLTALRDRSKELKEDVERTFKDRSLPPDFFDMVTVNLADGQKVTTARGFLVLGLGVMEEMKPRIIKEANFGRKYAKEISVSDQG